MECQVKQNYGLIIVHRQGGLQFDAVKECDPRMITAASAIEAVVEDPLLAILKKDANKT